MQHFRVELGSNFFCRNAAGLAYLAVALRCGRHKACVSAEQVGESMQIHSGGLLQATPHFVRAASSPAAAGISRNTFAVFMQPRSHVMLAPRCALHNDDVCVTQSMSRLVCISMSRHRKATRCHFPAHRWDEPMAPPGGLSNHDDIGVGQWRPGMTFGEFAEVSECKSATLQVSSSRSVKCATWIC